MEALSSLDDIFKIRYRYSFNDKNLNSELPLAWAEIIKIVGPNLYSPSSPKIIRDNLRSYIHEMNTNRTFISINEMDADTVKVHLAALGLLQIEAATSKGGGVL